MKLFARDETDEVATAAQQLFALREKLRGKGVGVVDVDGWGPKGGAIPPLGAIQHHTMGGSQFHSGGVIPQGNIYMLGMETVEPASRSIEDAKAKLAAARRALGLK